jgi:hypothetical protein
MEGAGPASRASAGASVSTPTPPDGCAAGSTRHVSASGVVLDHEGRPLRGGGGGSSGGAGGGGVSTSGRPVAAKACYGVLLYTRQDVDAGRAPVRALTRAAPAPRVPRERRA